MLSRTYACCFATYVEQDLNALIGGHHFILQLLLGSGGNSLVVDLFVDAVDHAIDGYLLCFQFALYK